MLVQETHSDTLNETDWRREWDGEVVLSHLSRIGWRSGSPLLQKLPAKVSCGGGSNTGQTDGG